MDSDRLTFNDHQAAELVFLRRQVAELRDTIEFLKEDNRELTKCYYKVLHDKHKET